MTRSSLTVIKVGGSLFDWPDLPSRLMEFLGGREAVDRHERIVLIAGGGAAADMVRGLDNMHRLGDETAHRAGAARHGLHRDGAGEACTGRCRRRSTR